MFKQEPRGEKKINPFFFISRKEIHYDLHFYLGGCIFQQTHKKENMLVWLRDSHIVQCSYLEILFFVLEQLVSKVNLGKSFLFLFFLFFWGGGGGGGGQTQGKFTIWKNMSSSKQLSPKLSAGPVTNLGLLVGASQVLLHIYTYTLS